VVPERPALCGGRFLQDTSGQQRTQSVGPSADVVHAQSSNAKLT
jgi:hypothetical protein